MDELTRILGRLLIYLGVLLVVIGIAIFTIWVFARKRKVED